MLTWVLFCSYISSYKPQSLFSPEGLQEIVDSRLCHCDSQFPNPTQHPLQSCHFLEQPLTIRRLHNCLVLPSQSIVILEMEDTNEYQYWESIPWLTLLPIFQNLSLTPPTGKMAGKCSPPVHLKGVTGQMGVSNTSLPTKWFPTPGMHFPLIPTQLALCWYDLRSHLINLSQPCRYLVFLQTINFLYIMANFLI